VSYIRGRFGMFWHCNAKFRTRTFRRNFRENVKLLSEFLILHTRNSVSLTSEFRTIYWGHQVTHTKVSYHSFGNNF